jgi:hypothetical protein
MRSAGSDRSARAVRSFCGDAARQMRGLETRLRTIVATAEPQPEMRLLEEAVGSTLRIAETILDAGRRGQHGTLLAMRPLLRALSTPRRST